MNYEIYALTETWLYADINDQELGFFDHFIYRNDRYQSSGNTTRGGGVLLSVSTKLNSKKLKCLHKHLEQVFVMVSLKKEKLIIGCTYIPPSSGLQTYKDHHLEVETMRRKFPDATFILMGDYNLPNIIWDIENIASSSPDNINHGSHEILEMSNFLNLHQKNHVYNINSRLLDLVFTNSPSVNVYSSDEMILPIDKYHPPLIINYLNIYVKVIDPTIVKRNFEKADYPKIVEFLSTYNWAYDLTCKSSSLDEALEYFYNVIYQAIDNFVPLQKYYTSKFPKWFDSELINLTYDKKIAHKRYKINRTLDNYIAFSTLRKDCTRKSKECFKKYTNNVENSILTNINKFWNYTNSFRKNNSNFPGTMFYGKKVAHDKNDIANLFADFFKSVYVEDNDNILSDKPQFTESSLNLHNIHVEVNDVVTFIKQLDKRSNSGPDMIPSILLKNCIHVLALPITIIFNLSLSTGCFPEIWKSSFITPIFKKGDKCQIENYRPICIMSSLPKLFEQIILSKIMHQIKPIISTFQHGFMPDRSTLSNLLLYENFISNALSKGLQVDTIYTDFSKAFDTVSHRILMEKLEHLGISGNFLEWLRSYLSYRKLSVKITSTTSYTFFALSGVPQGSHLGPILFLLFINDISIIFDNIHFLLFADDLKMFRSIENSSNCLTLQRNLNKLYEWCIVNKLHLNVNKCQTISFHRSKTPLLFDYSINNATLKRVLEFNDLGVIFDSKLRFLNHIISITSKGLQMLGFILRIAKDFNNIKTIKLLYTSLVRSQVEYNSTIWCPHFNSHCLQIEKIQNKFLRFINFKFGIPILEINYVNLRSKLNLSKLSERRKIFDLILLYKIVHSRLDCPDAINLLSIHIPPKHTRRNILFYNNNFAMNSVLERIHRLGNELTDVADIFNLNFNTFKAKLVHHFLNVNNE